MEPAKFGHDWAVDQNQVCGVQKCVPHDPTTREASESDQQTIKEWLFSMPFIDRGKPVRDEGLWVLLGRPNPDQHQKLLPDYCYNIFDVFRKTYFKGFPSLSEIIQVKDQTLMASGKTVEDAKKALLLLWRNLGKLCGVATRCMRFAELEAKAEVDSDGFEELAPDRRREFFTVIFGKQWAEENRSRITSESPGKILSEMLNRYLTSKVEEVKGRQPEWDALAYAWSPDAMIELKAGMAEGMASFLDTNGEFAGESRRAGIYWFLLFTWPEIKVMLQANPKKTMSNLQKWMKPFMRMGMVTYLETDELQDVCEPPPKGIGLSLRPLKPRELAST